MVTAEIKWIEGHQFVAESGTGHAMVLDVPMGADKHGTGPTPMELMLMGTAGCSAMDMAYILGERMRADLQGLTVSAEADRADKEPKVFTAVRLTYRLRGNDLKEKDVVRAITLSLTKYCSASAMIERTAAVTARYEITDNAAATTTTGELAVPDPSGG
jgi:putative redox protein